MTENLSKGRGRQVLLPQDFTDADLVHLANTRAPKEAYTFDNEAPEQAGLDGNPLSANSKSQPASFSNTTQTSCRPGMKDER